LPALLFLFSSPLANAPDSFQTGKEFSIESSSKLLAGNTAGNSGVASDE
jgi:hypothetical protein